METTPEPLMGGTALIVVPGVGDDAAGDTVGSMSGALLAELGSGWHGAPVDRTIVVPPLEGSGDDPTVHEVRAVRIDGPGQTPPLVVYEMHWSDLSRFPGTLRRFVVTLYGLLFQIATIGMEAFRGSNVPTGPRWLIRIFSYLTTVWILGLTAGAAILGIEFGALLKLTSHEAHVVIAGLTLALVAVLALYGDSFLRSRGWRFDWVPAKLGRPGIAFAVIAIGVGLAPAIVHARNSDGEPLDYAVHDVLWLGVTWILPVAWAAVGATAILITLTMLVYAFANHWTGDRYKGNRTAVLSVVVGGLGIALLGALLVAGGLTLTTKAVEATTPVDCSLITEVGAAGQPCDFGHYSEAVFARSLRPMGVALLCAAVLLLAALIFAFRYASAMAQARQSAREPLSAGWEYVALSAIAAVAAVILATRSARATEPIALVAGLIAAVPIALVWWYGFRPSITRRPFRRGFDVLLSYFGSLWHAALVCLALVVAAAVLVLATPLTETVGGWVQDLTDTLFDPLTSLVSGSTDTVSLSLIVAALVALAALARNKLAAIAKGLDVAYDVATYMRIPHGGLTDGSRVEPPRRKILRRYAAVVDHVQAVQKPAKIVVVAHSQGSMYTLALLFGDAGRDEADIENAPDWPLAPRILPGASAIAREKAPTLSAPLTLLTAGCPALQTYAPNFPDQYESLHDAPAVDARLAQLPNGAKWRNVYRSGDYFGRALWSDEIACVPPDPAPPAPAQRLEEHCLGAGHHTGYWGDHRFAAQVLAQI